MSGVETPKSNPGPSKTAELIVLKEKALNSQQASHKTTTSAKANTTLLPRFTKLVGCGKQQSENNADAAKPKQQPAASMAKQKIGTPSHSSHMTSHLNLPNFMSTPTNRNIKNMHINGLFIKQETSGGKEPVTSATKKVAPRTSEKLAHPTSLTKPPRVTPHVTPTSKINYLSSKSSQASNSRLEGFDINPVVNGVDYSAIMSRKAELGYKGRGYIVQFDCEEKYLKGACVEFGLWQAISHCNGPRDNTLLYLGPSIFLERIDSEIDKKRTPSKSPFTKFDFHHRVVNTIERSSNIPSSSMAHSLDLETKHHSIKKKSLRWADNLERIEESHLSGSSTPRDTMPLAANGDTSREWSRNGGVAGNTPSSASNLDETKKATKQMRRSFSLSDINNVILKHEDEDEEDDLRVIRSINLSTGEEKEQRINETFELDKPGSPSLDRPKICSPVPYRQHVSSTERLDDASSTSRTAHTSSSNSSMASLGVANESRINESSSLRVSPAKPASTTPIDVINSKLHSLLSNCKADSKFVELLAELKHTLKITTSNTGEYMRFKAMLNELQEILSVCKDSVTIALD